MSATPVVVAIDQGTTSTRSVSLDADGKTTVRHAVEHQQFYPNENWVEHDPEELVQNIELCLEASGGADAIAIDNQGESCLAWDAETKEPLSQVVVWQDSRTQKAVDQLKLDGVEPEVLSRSGLPLDSYFSASKLAWLYESLPEAKSLHSRGRLRLGTTDAFFLDRLTGHCKTDISTASRTSLLNIDTGEWDSELCRIFNVPIDALPPVSDSTGDFGSIQVCGKKIPVTASIVDQQAALYGHGCRANGDAKITFGTGAFALMVTGSKIVRAPEKGLLPTVAWRHAGEPATFAIDGGVYTAGAAVNWARGLGLFETFDQINAFDGEPAIEKGLVFVPALAGLACPHWNRDARGTWFGMALETKKQDLVRAVLEGVAFRTAEVIDAMNTLIPVSGDLSIDGGLSSNPYFMQFLCNVLERPIVVSSEAELTASGAARMAADCIGKPVPSPESGQRYITKTPRADTRERFAEACRLAASWSGRV